MKFAARWSGLELFSRVLVRNAETLAIPAAEAAADALASELERSKEAEGIEAPLLRTRMPKRHSLAVSDADAIAREFGTLDNEPAPWLAPVLPAARGPMRAAAVAAAVRALSKKRLRKR